MGLLDALTTVIADSAGKDVINQHIAKYGKLKSLSFEEGTIYASVVLNGLDDKEISISCASVNIAEDGSQISLGDFSASVPCIEQALNDFCSRTFQVKSTKAQRWVVIARKLLF